MSTKIVVIAKLCNLNDLYNSITKFNSINL